MQVNKNNINNFFTKIEKLTKPNQNKIKDMYIGFFGYRLLCGLINVKKTNQRSNNFPNGIFYKPQTIIKIRKKISIQSILYINLINYMVLLNQ